MSFEGYQQPIAESLNRVDQRLKEAERERVEAYSTTVGAGRGTRVDRKHAVARPPHAGGARALGRDAASTRR